MAHPRNLPEKKGILRKGEHILHSTEGSRNIWLGEKGIHKKGTMNLRGEVGGKGA